MRIQPLYDLQQDINRLFIAGSKFAKNDPRLQKQIPLFNKMGEKAPVFKKLASELEALTQADSMESSLRLMGVSTLLYSILYTQGEMLEPEQEQKEQVPLFNTSEIDSNYSYLQLKPVIKALSESNSGRLEIIQDAYKQGIFKDYRTYPYLEKALGDKYTELAECVENIIKEAKDPILPYLIKNFSYEGKTADIRRLRLLHHLNYEGIDEIVKTIMEGSSVNLQAEAIQILAEDPVNEKLIIELSSAKNKTLREAAYVGLAKLNTKTSLDKLKELYLTNKNKGNLEALAKAIGMVGFPDGMVEILEKFNQNFEAILNLTKDTEEKEVMDRLEKLNTELFILENKDIPETYTILEKLLTDQTFHSVLTSKKGRFYSCSWNTSIRVIGIMRTLSSEKLIRLFEKVTPLMKESKVLKNLASNLLQPIFRYYLELAVAADYSSERVYEIFMPLYKLNLIDVDDLEAYCLKDVKVVPIDLRWVDLVFEHLDQQHDAIYKLKGSLDFIHQYEPKDSRRFKEVLYSFFQNPEKYTVYKYNVSPFLKTIILLAIERKVDKCFELIYALIAKVATSFKYLFYELSEEEIWKEFPKEYAGKIRELNKNFSMSSLEKIAAKIEEGN